MKVYPCNVADAVCSSGLVSPSAENTESGHADWTDESHKGECGDVNDKAGHTGAISSLRDEERSKEDALTI